MDEKVKVLVRNPYDYLRETKKDIHKISRNISIKPFTQEREYVKATNASKIERFLSKPFIRSLDGALDDVQVMSVDPKNISLAAFGTADGKIQYWNISSNIKYADLKVHDGLISGISHFDESNFITCGYDKVINQWNFLNKSNSEIWLDDVVPTNTFSIQDVPQCLSSQLFDEHFAIGTSESVLIYKLSHSQSEPFASFGKERESVHCVKFQPTETNILCSLTRENNINLYDIRHSNISAQVKMSHKSTSMSFNPKYPMYFTTSSDDYNLYTFDMRKLTQPIRVHKGHVKSVSDVCYSNRGLEFVTASVDKTIRIFNKDDSKARELYFDRRMARVLTVKYTQEDRYILSSSTDHNVRLWKTHAAEKLGPKTPREQQSLLESQKLREKYSKNPLIQKIQNRRNVPKSIRAMTNEHRIIEQKQNRKERNVIQHSKPGTIKKKSKLRKGLVDNDV